MDFFFYVFQQKKSEKFVKSKNAKMRTTIFEENFENFSLKKEDFDGRSWGGAAGGKTNLTLLNLVADRFRGVRIEVAPMCVSGEHYSPVQKAKSAGVFFQGALKIEQK